jgi:hypothetical protein
LKYVGLLAVDNMPTIMESLNESDLALFLEKAVWLPRPHLHGFPDPVINRHLEFYDIISDYYLRLP